MESDTPQRHLRPERADLRLREVEVRFPTANATMPAKIPKMTITMSGSTRVKPRSMML